MPSRKDTSEFIAEARAVHGERYDYSKVVYVEYRNRVEIICPVHGSFWQTPALHVKGRNCRKCAQQKRTEGVAVYCRFCGVRVMYADAGKQRCQSEACVLKHKLETHRATGDSKVDFIRVAWSREKKRQRMMALSPTEKRCRYAYRSAWMAKKYRSESIKKSEEGAAPLTESVLKRRARDKRRWAEMSPWEKKAKYFVRETNSGRRHMKNRKGNVRVRQLLEKLNQQGNACAISGLPISESDADIDHIIPVSRGGSSEIENLQWVSRKINRMKGSMTSEEFVDMCLMVAKHTLHNTPTPPV